MFKQKIKSKLTKLRMKSRKHYFVTRHKFHGTSVGKVVKRMPQWARISSLVLIVGIGGYAILAPTISRATPQTLTLQSDDFLSGTSSYSEVSLTNNAQSLELQSGLIGQWNSTTDPGIQAVPVNIDGASNLAYGPNKTLYLMSAFDRQCTLNVYSIESQSWSRLKTPPVTCGSGTIFEYDGAGSFYYLPGGSSAYPSNRIFRYDIATNSWTGLADFPSSVSNISSGTIVTQGSRKYIYMFRGMSSPSFWRYDIAANTWMNLPSFPTSGNVANGVSLVWDQANNLYAVAGHTGEFKRYDLVSNTWTNLTTLSSPSSVRYTLAYRNGTIVAAKNNTNNERTGLDSYEISSGTWTSHPEAPIANIWDYPLPVAYDGSRYAYMLMGPEIRPDLQRFDFTTNKWSTVSLMSPYADNTGYHQSLIHDGSRYIYYSGGPYGNNTNRLYRFDTTDNTTTQIGSQISGSAGYGGTFYNGSLYLLTNGGTGFKRFDLGTNTYSDLTSLAVTTGEGAELVDGGDGFLYLVYGGGRTTFQRYSVSTNTWTTLTASPQTVGAGGGATRIGRAIYVIAANNSGYFMRYDMDAATWSTLTSLPNGSASTGSIITSDKSRYVYISPNSRLDATARKLYRYDTTTTEWLRMADTPAVLKNRASAVYDATGNTMYVAQGSHSPAIWKWNPSATSYGATGTWLSKKYDLTQVQTWTSLTRTVTGTGTATFSTRTSADGNIWTDWQQVTGNAIQSPTNRYFQFKVVLAGDGTNTPHVSNISLQYDQETNPPALPSQFSAKSSKAQDAQALSTGVDYEHQHPYFSWTGANDGANGAGVDGYYVYYGTSSNADPVSDGNYQTTADYTVSTPMIAGEVYYLRIKVKDRLGNTSAAATYFSYRYFYISPPESIIKSTDSDFSMGTNSGVTIENNTMKLRAASQGSWSTGAVAMPPDNTYGSAMTIVGNSMYVARGATSTVFWRYDIANQVWSSLAPVPSNVNSGSSLVSDKKGNLYLVAGNGTNAFYRYNIENDVWTSVGTGLPSNAQAGTDIVYIGNDKFLVLFTGVREFYQYDLQANTYTPLTSYPTTITNSGSGIWFDGNDTLYTYLGAWSWDNARASRNAMAQYSISTDSWRILADPPVIAYNTQNNLVTDGQGNLYVFANTQYDNLDKNQRMMRYNIANDSWSEVNTLYAEVFGGSATSDGSRYLYLLPGGNGTNSRKMIRYDSWTGQFTPGLTSIDSRDRIPYDVNNAAPWVGGNASTATYDGSKYIYAIAGSESTSSVSIFVKFDYKTGKTVQLPQPPVIGLNGSLSYFNGALYYVPGKSTRELYKFEESNQQWRRMADAPNTIYRPGSSSLIATANALYTARGNTNTFYRYTPDGGTGVWATMANAPGTILNGSSLYDAQANVIYVAAGNSNTSFYRYNIAANTWTSLASHPATSAYGSTLVMSAGKIYMQRGGGVKTSSIYDIASNTWSAGIDAPENFSYGSNALKVSDSTAIVFAGQSVPDIWQFNFPTSTTSFSGQATHISQPFEAHGIFDYSGITAQVDIPAHTAVELWTRTSDDSNTWSDWQIATDIKKYNTSVSGIIQSDAKRFTQVKIVMESNDNLYTPTVRSYAINYYYDIDPPTNPSVLNAYSDATKTVSLTNNIWYNHDKPTFDWPDAGQPGGPTDGPLGSNIAGYWIYVGTDPTASPRTQGVFVPASEYTPTLTLPGTYFVRLQTQDVTGNVDGNIFAPFSYKFDNQPPANPSLITVTPSGFTTQNNYSFVWPNAYDANSGVAGYCYHTGANSGPFAADICQAGTSLNDVSAAYRSGTNVFYVRAYDTAGNYAPSYTTVSYYYTTDPPGPATNLRAVPPTSTQNMFAFAWDLPITYSGDPNQMTYCYSVNVLPTPTNTTCTSERFIAAFKAATQQGTNVLYIVSRDEADNANWNNFATANFIANTVSPGIPLNVVATDTSDRATNRWSITLTWDVPTFTGNGIKDYIVERSMDGHAFTSIGNTSNRAYVDLDIQPDTQYYYRIRAQDGVNNVGGASGVVSRTAQGYFTQPPEIVVPPTASSDFDQARITWVTSRESTSFVYYGTAPNNLTQSKGSLDAVASHTQTLTGLQPSTTYYYRVQSFDERRNYNLNDSYSEIASFRTASAAQIENVSISDVTSNSAVLSWETSIPTKSRISYGRDQDYGFEAESEDDYLSTKHTQKLTSLPSGTTHHFKIASTTNFGSTFTSDDYTFTTIARPEVSNVRFQPVEDGPTAGVLIAWTTNVPTSSTVYYSNNGNRLESTKSELTTNHEMLLKDLASNTEYEITVEGRDQYGNLGSSSLQRWMSSLDTRAPKITEAIYNVTTTGAGENKKAQLIVSWRTDEPATSQVLYDQGDKKELKNQSPLSTTPTTSHTVIISNLSLADIYKVQIITRDLDGNTTYGTMTTVVTPDREVSVFDNVLDLMLRLFRF